MEKTIVISNKNKHIINLLSSMEKRKAELKANMDSKIEKMMAIKNLKSA